MLATENLREAGRLMTICNSCRYCEGLCAVFPAMELRRAFSEGDLNLLANLCHNCGACFDACQFAPPHDFGVNVPQALARTRRDSWETYVWPKAFAGLFRHNAAVVSIGTALMIAQFLAAIAAFRDPTTLFTVHTGPGAFYRIVPHDVLACLFGAVFSFALFAMAMGLCRFWRDVGQSQPLPPNRPSLWQAASDACSLRYLGGGGAGCFNDGDISEDRRKVFHHLTFYGFLFCFAATCIATVYHYAFGWTAPYPWWDLPVVLGTLGGMGLVIGPIGLIAARRQRRAELGDPRQHGMDTAFTLLLLLTSVSGLALLALRETPAMGVVLAVHLGFVCAFFLAMPYSRFVHGAYRFTALLRYALEMRQLPSSSDLPR